MTPLDTSICWAVLAPLPTTDLEQVVAGERTRNAPCAIDPPPWQTLPGAAGYNALVSRFPGTEGSDRHFAEMLSQRAPGKSVYALWLHPERRAAFEWKDGREAVWPGFLDALAEQLGFCVAPDALPDRIAPSVAVVEGASLEEVRQALGDSANEEWLHVHPGPAGVLLTATDGLLGTQAWDVAAALPSATVYYVQQGANSFEVLLLRGVEEEWEFRVPPLEGGTNTLPNIKGETVPSAIMRALGIPPDALVDAAR